jgi:Tfp pilus assembly protein PilX
MALRYPSTQHRRNQRGSTLIVGLIMLVLMTLIALSAITMSTGNLKIVGNMQYQQEATNAAQAAINQVFSQTSYFTAPTTMPTSIDVTINGATYSVSLAQPCLQASSVIAVRDLANDTDPADVVCTGSWVQENPGIGYEQAGNAGSSCSRVVWQLKATVNDTSTNAHVELVEGASMKMLRAIADVYKNNASYRCAV